LDTHREEAQTALPNKHYSGHHMATEIQGDQRTSGNGPGTAGCRYRLEEDGGGSI